MSLALTIASAEPRPKLSLIEKWMGGMFHRDSPAAALDTSLKIGHEDRVPKANSRAPLPPEELSIDETGETTLRIYPQGWVIATHDMLDPTSRVELNVSEIPVRRSSLVTTVFSERVGPHSFFLGVFRAAQQMGFLDHPGQLMCMLGQEVSVTRFKSQEDAILQARAFLDRSDDPAVPPFLRISFLSRDTCVDTPSWAAKKIASFWWERREAFAPAAIGGPLADMGVSAPFSYFCRQDGILTYFTQRMTALRTLDPHGFSAREGARKRFSAFCGTLVLQVERESQIEHFPAYAPPAPLLPPKQQRQIPARFEWSEPLFLISRMPVARHVA